MKPDRFALLFALGFGTILLIAGAPAWAAGGLGGIFYGLMVLVGRPIR